jgi:polysaccharide biosynthesis/export protein
MRRFGARAGVIIVQGLLWPALGLLLAGCNLPGGAAFESEVLAVASDEDAATPDFAVEVVTRDALPRYADWPLTGETPLRWISRQSAPANRIIAPGDQISVTVWNTEQNSLLTAGEQRFVPLSNIRVSPGGTIFLPYLGDIRIEGMSPEHAREVIQEKFIAVTPAAQVQLELTEGRQSSVSLVGGVNQPGTFPLPDQAYTVLSLIAEGRGVREQLNNPQIRLIRGDDIYGTSVDRLFANPDLDTTLRGGDKVIIRADDRYFLSLGAAGSEAVHPFERDRFSALEALSIIGGVSDNRADPKGILVLRQYPASAVRQDGTGPAQERVVFTLDLTSADGLFSAGQFRIQSGDLVYATESPVLRAQTILSLIGNAFGIANTAASTAQRLSN